MAQRSGTGVRALAAAALLLLAGSAYAQSGAYVGFGFGEGRADFDELGEVIADEADSTVIKFYAGYRLGFLALEAFYSDLRHYSATFQGGGTLATEVDGPGASLFLYVPIGSKTEFFVKGGAFRWDVDAGPVVRDHDFDPVYGVGLNLFGMGPHASLRIEYERYMNVGSDLVAGEDAVNIDTLTLGLSYTF